VTIAVWVPYGHRVPDWEPWPAATSTVVARADTVQSCFCVLVTRYAACRAANLDDFTFHDLRHTCAAWLVTGGAPLAEIRDLLGHSKIMMTERYAHLAPENLRTTVGRLDMSRSGGCYRNGADRMIQVIDHIGARGGTRTPTE